MTTYYIAPDGDDTTGDGSILSPWRTLAKVYGLMVAGDKTYCRGGTYASTVLDALVVTSDGTAGSPISVLAYPGETPIFEGTDDTYNSLGFDGAHYHVIDGLHFQNFITTGAAIIYMGSSVATSHIKIRRCKFMARAGLTINEHGVYVSGYASDITIGGAEGYGNIFVGTYGTTNEGAGVEVYHTPGATNVVVSWNVFDAWRQGVQGAADAASDVTVLHNTFVNCYTNIDFRNGTTGLIRDNAGESGDNADIYLEIGTTPTNDHNYWGETITAAPFYVLTEGSPAIAGALDGSDAGWGGVIATRAPSNWSQALRINRKRQFRHR